MPTYELEYSICQIQSGDFSIAAKSHRQEQGNPRLTITCLAQGVEWRLTDLDHGIPQTVTGEARRNRVDFYFRLESLRAILPTFPAARGTLNPAMRLSPTNSCGEERIGGIGVRMVAPVCRFFPVLTTDLFSQRAPAFWAHADEASLHLDFETGPARIYGNEIYEVHFGIEAEYTIAQLPNPTPSHVVIMMCDDLYATILSELRHTV